MRIHVLGPTAIGDSSAAEPSLSASLRQLLAVLVASGERGLPQDSIAEELWGDDLPPSWESAFRNAVTRLRNKLGRSTLEMTSGRYHLAPSYVEVDAWELLSVGIDAPFEERHLASYLLGTPFLGIELSPTIRFMSDQIEVARSGLVRTLSADDMPSLGAESLALLRAHQRQHNYNDELLEMVIRAHLKAEQTTRALAILSEARIEADIDDRLVPLRLLVLEDAIRRQRSPGAVLARVDVDQPINHLPQELALALEGEQIGRQAELHNLLEAAATVGTALLVGRGGTGKTWLLARAADHLAAAGYEIRYAPGQGNVDAAYGPLLAAIPEAASEVRSVLAASDDRWLTQHECHAVLLASLERSRNLRTCLVIDDGHLLDSHSESFVRFLAERKRSTVTVIIAARSDWADQGWQPFRRALMAADTPEVQINALSRYELVELARLVHPEANTRLLTQLADDVMTVTGGLPGIARHFLQRADAHNLLIETYDNMPSSASEALGIYSNSFSQLAQTVGLGAAVLGHTVDLHELTSLLGLDPDATRQGCQELIRGEFFRETSAPDRYSFVHALHREAMLALATDDQFHSLHRNAAELLTNIKRQARHYAAAVPLVDESIARDALIKASCVYFEEGAWRECASVLRDAQRRSNESLAIEDLCRFAAALDLSGANGSLLREKAFQAACAQADWSLALQVATSGVQAAERVHGDAERTALLERVPYEKLDSHERFTLATTLVRQRLFLGPASEAVRWCKLAQQEASTPDENLMAFVNSALTSGDAAPVSALVVPSDFEAVASDITKLRGLQISAISHLERASSGEVEPILAKLSHLTNGADDPYRTWHHMVLSDALMFISGEMQAAGEMSIRTSEYGQRHGIGDAEGAHLAFVFFAHLINEQLHLLRPDLERFAGAGRSLVHRLMTAVVANAGPRRSAEAAEDISTVALECVESRSMFAIPTLILGVEEIRAAVNQDSRELIYNHLLPRAATASVLANGVILAGPVDRALAVLALGEPGRIAHLEAAIAVADRQEARLWQVLCRLELAALGIDRHGEDAQALADTPDLASLVARHL